MEMFVELGGGEAVGPGNYPGYQEKHLVEECTYKFWN
jgi:hypothetical protein